MVDCLLCQTRMQSLIEEMQDWEYGVTWNSKLVICPDCGLVSHSPQVKADEIASLYPRNYLAHSPANGQSGLYGKLKHILARRTARQIASRVPQDGSLLEIGCGNGHLLRTIAAVRPDVKLFGVDIKKVEIPKLEDFQFHHGQFEDIDIEANSIDLIYCSNLIEHVPNPLLFAKKIKTTLRKKGVVLGVTPDHLSLDRFLFGKYWAGYHYPRHTFVFNHRNIATILRAAGFDDIRISGAYSFWYLSLANKFSELPGTKKRGILFAVVTSIFLPFDLLINLIRVHGSMTFIARAPD